MNNDQLTVPVKIENETNDDDEDEKPTPTNISQNSLEMSCLASAELFAAKAMSLDGLELTIAPFFAKYLVLAIRDRIRHGRHFTFKSENLAITFVSESVTGGVVSKNDPYGLLGYWMQVRTHFEAILFL